MSDNPSPGGAVFLSYAREDGAAARRIAEALRGFGIEVWFDVSELRGGDAWDQKIRRQIKECTLFIPVISAQTQEREEGYFRREWRLAVDRTHDMAESRAFIVPVIVDATREADANVPEQFLKAHFTRLPGGEPTPQFVEQVKRLLQPAGASRPAARGAAPAAATPAKPGPPWVSLALGVAVLALVAFIFLRPAAKPDAVAVPVSAPPPAMPAKTAELALPVADAKSIAVLPFVDMSQAKDQEYFSDGLSEELLNLLAKVPALKVTSRSSAFSYKGKEVKLSQVAKELGVAHVLEGSVRKSGNRLRITAQLIDARTDTHLWSETYDRSLDDIFAVQDEIAAAVVGQLKLSLLGEAPKTKQADPKAYSLYLQGRQLIRTGDLAGFKNAQKLLEDAVAIDPGFVDAWCQLSFSYRSQSDLGLRSNEEGYRLAREALDKALALDPNSGLAHAYLGTLLASTITELTPAAAQFERALALEPTNTEIMTSAMGFARGLGRYELVAAMGAYVVAHDPLNSQARAMYGAALVRAGREEEGLAHLRMALQLIPGRGLAHYTMGMTLLKRRDFDGALAEFKQEPTETWRLDGLTMAYHALGRKADSDAALSQIIAKYEKEAPWNIAYMYAYRGEADKCFEWLDRAVAYRDPGLSLMAISWQFENVFQDPRWRPFLRKVGRAPEQVAAVKFDVKIPAN
jgi:TolB-like protein/thioredoxin-like negative regulator of GroEL